MIINGKILEIDQYNKIKIIVYSGEPLIIIQEDNIKPYKIIDNDCIYFIKANKHHLDIIRRHIGESISVEVSAHRYYFEDKKGTRLILKSILSLQ